MGGPARYARRATVWEQQPGPSPRLMKVGPAQDWGGDRISPASTKKTEGALVFGDNFVIASWQRFLPWHMHCRDQEVKEFGIFGLGFALVGGY